MRQRVNASIRLCACVKRVCCAVQRVWANGADHPAAAGFNECVDATALNDLPLVMRRLRHPLQITTVVVLCVNVQ